MKKAYLSVLSVFLLLSSPVLFAGAGKGNITINNKSKNNIMVAFKGAGCAHVFKYTYGGSTLTGCEQKTIPAGGQITYSFGTGVTNRHVRVVAITTPQLIESTDSASMKYWNDHLLNATIPMQDQDIYQSHNGHDTDRPNDKYYLSDYATIKTTGNCSEGGGWSIKLGNGKFNEIMDISNVRFEGKGKEPAIKRSKYLYDFHCEYSVHNK